MGFILYINLECSIQLSVTVQFKALKNLKFLIWQSVTKLHRERLGEKYLYYAYFSFMD